MKIDETPSVSGRTNERSSLARQSPLMGGLDELELSFLDLLNSVESVAVAGSKSESPTDYTARVQVVERETERQSVEKAAKAEKAAAASDEKTVKAETPESREADLKALEMLKVEMSGDDLRYLKDVVIPSLPILQGSVPIAQAFPKGESGFDTRGLAVSRKLTDLIEQGIKTGRPVRVELDGESSVVLKFRNGRVSAEFMSNDKAAALYLKQNLDELRARLEAKNLPVDLLQYREQRRQRSRQESDPKES